MLRYPSPTCIRPGSSRALSRPRNDLGCARIVAELNSFLPTRPKGISAAMINFAFAEVRTPLRLCSGFVVTLVVALFALLPLAARAGEGKAAPATFRAAAAEVTITPQGSVPIPNLTGVSTGVAAELPSATMATFCRRCSLVSTCQAAMTAARSASTIAVSSKSVPDSVPEFSASIPKALSGKMVAANESNPSPSAAGGIKSDLPPPCARC